MHTYIPITSGNRWLTASDNLQAIIINADGLFIWEYHKLHKPLKCKPTVLERIRTSLNRSLDREDSYKNDSRICIRSGEPNYLLAECTNCTWELQILQFAVYWDVETWKFTWTRVDKWIFAEIAITSPLLQMTFYERMDRYSRRIDINFPRNWWNQNLNLFSTKGWRTKQVTIRNNFKVNK